MDATKDEDAVAKGKANKRQQKSPKRSKKDRKADKTANDKKKEHKQKKKDKKGQESRKRPATDVAGVPDEPKRLTGTGLEDGEMADDFLEELLQPVRDADEEDMQEADFWNGVGEEEDFLDEDSAAIAETAGEPVQEEASIQTSDVDGNGATHDTLVVTVEDAKVLQEKLAVLAKVSGARLELLTTTLYIRGPKDIRTRANGYVHAVLDKGLPQGAGCEDVTVVSVLPEWAETWDGRQAMEQELSVLIKMEALAGRTALAVGQMAGLPYRRQSWSGWVERFQPVIVKTTSPGATKAKVMWCWDGALEEADGSKLQPAVRVSIYGRLQDRAMAVGQILAAADREAAGLMAAQVDALRRNYSDLLLQSEGGPGADGLQEFDLGCDALVMKRFLRPQDSKESTRNETLESVLLASGCKDLHIYRRPVADEFRFCCLVLGHRSQRWLAAEILRTVLHSLDARSSSALHSKLHSDCTLVKVPHQAVGQIFGKQRKNLLKLMSDTQTVIVKVKEVKSAEAEKQSAEEVTSFMTNMYQAEDGSEFAVFGKPLAQKRALASIFATVERLVPGYVLPMSPQEKIDELQYGLDKLRLPFEFQENASNVKAEILSCATDCHAACVADLLLLAGDQHQRQRAREYAYFLRGKHEGQFPNVPGLGTRSDACSLWVDERASKSRWFLDELKKLMLETKTCAFFDDGHDAEKKLRRLVFAGFGVTPDSIPDICESAQSLVQKAIDWIDQRCRKQEPKASKPWTNWKDAKTWNSWEQTSKSWEQNSRWTSEISKLDASADWSREISDVSQIEVSTEMPCLPPMTPALPKPSEPSPSIHSMPTAAGFGPHGGAAPRTPAFHGLDADGRSPCTFGPHGAMAPKTPAISNTRNRIPPPATPASFGTRLPADVPEPATPAPLRVPAQTVPGPLTPAPPPATPVTSANSAAPAAGMAGTDRRHTVSDPATPTVWRDPPSHTAGYLQEPPPPQTPTVAPARAPPQTPAAIASMQRGESTGEFLPPGWQRCFSRTHKKPYYFNAKLNKSQYVRPA